MQYTMMGGELYVAIFASYILVSLHTFIMIPIPFLKLFLKI